MNQKVLNEAMELLPALLTLAVPGMVGVASMGPRALGAGVVTAAPKVEKSIALTKKMKELDKKISGLEAEVAHYQNLATQPHLKYMKNELANYARSAQERLTEMVRTRSQVAQELLNP